MAQLEAELQDHVLADSFRALSSFLCTEDSNPCPPAQGALGNEEAESVKDLTSLFTNITFGLQGYLPMSVTCPYLLKAGQH